VKQQLLALAMTVFGALLILSGVALLVAGGTVGYWFAAKFGFSKVYMAVLSVLRWPLTAALTIFVAGSAYHVLPNLKQKFKCVTYGSVFATVVWLAAAWGFGVYVDRWSSYGAMYGSIGGVIILLTWFYISAVIFLIGGELNAAVRRTLEKESPAAPCADDAETTSSSVAGETTTDQPSIPPRGQEPKRPEGVL
jgi:membrane protein